jgi:hypothetical protein
LRQLCPEEGHLQALGQLGTQTRSAEGTGGHSEAQDSSEAVNCWCVVISTVYCANHSPAAKVDIYKTLEAKLDNIQSTVDRAFADIHDRLHNIEQVNREMAKNTTGVNLSGLNLRIPPAPLFDAPSPAISNASAVSATSTSSGINISRMSLASPIVAGPSGTKSGPSDAQGE